MVGAIQISPPVQVNRQLLETPCQKLKTNPAQFLAKWLYASRPVSKRAPDPHLVTVVCISYTHATTSEIPIGDILLHAGDLTNKGTFAGLQSQLDWLNTLPHQHKMVIGVNHDLLLDDDFVSSFLDEFFRKMAKRKGPPLGKSCLREEQQHHSV